MSQTTTVTIKKLDDKQRRGKRRIKRLKIQHFLLTGKAPFVKTMEKKGR